MDTKHMEDKELFDKAVVLIDAARSDDNKHTFVIQANTSDQEKTEVSVLSINIDRKRTIELLVAVLNGLVNEVDESSFNKKDGENE